MLPEEIAALGGSSRNVDNQTQPGVWAEVMNCRITKYLKVEETQTDH